MAYHGGRFKVKKKPKTIYGSEQLAPPCGACCFNMEGESLNIITNYKYSNR